ncbi:UNVERIFIED_CONTAM: hypothetical protein Sindi_2493000 [Sesamum indicum]
MCDAQADVPWPNGFGRNLRSKTRWFTGFCNSHQVSHFATFFIDARAEISVAESRFDIRETSPPPMLPADGATVRRTLCSDFLGAYRAGARAGGRGDRTGAFAPRRGLDFVCFDNDPSAGSPTETLLRLLLPLNDKVQWTSRDIAGSEPPTSPRSEHFTGPFNRPKLVRQPWKAAIWKAFIPPKYSFILWLGLRGGLATRDRLGFLQEEDLCSLCINTKESAKHLFFECPFSNFVWSRI